MAMTRNVRNRKAKGVARHETRPIKFKLKVRTQNTTPQPAPVYPAPTHGRPNPYTAILQHGLAFPKERGNAPAGASDAVWAEAYNCANSYVYNREAISRRIAVAKKARQDGLIRDLAVEKLVERGVLSKDFVDAAP